MTVKIVFPFLLVCVLLNVAVTQAQVNRSLAIDYFNRGSTKLDAGDLDGAMADFSRAIELDRHYAAPYFNRGLVRRRKADYDGAITDFSKAIELNPIAEAYLDRGVTRKDKGDRDGAIDDYTKAIALNAGYADAFYNRGIALD